jgi:hypothetical protein
VNLKYKFVFCNIRSPLLHVACYSLFVMISSRVTNRGTLGFCTVSRSVTPGEYSTRLLDSLQVMNKVVILDVTADGNGGHVKWI